MTAPRIMAVGTHHKTGTVWMRRTFHRYASDRGYPVVRMNRPSSVEEIPGAGPALCVNWASHFPAGFLDRADVRAVHVIRDPRDVLLSGQRYHLTAKTGNEKWLARPRRAFGGRSYQEAIRALPTRVEQLLFEMRGKHAETVAEMLAWPYGHRHAIDLRFETLVTDTDCTMFRAALDRAGVTGFGPDEVTEYYWRHALFGGLADPAARKGLVKAHVKSGAVAQWRERLPREVAELYAAEFGAALITLGYAEDMRWVEECRPEADLAAAAG